MLVDIEPVMHSMSSLQMFTTFSNALNKKEVQVIGQKALAFESSCFPGLGIKTTFDLLQHARTYPEKRDAI